MAEHMFGSIEAMKLRSLPTLFREVSGEDLFAEALDRWFGGEADGATINVLECS